MGNMFGNTVPERLYKKVISTNVLNTFVNVTVTCSDGKTFHVHSCFLAEQSPVLARMLENQNFKEGKTHEITVPDIRADTMIEILGYIYMERIATEKFIPLAYDILDAVEKYDLLEKLKEKCYGHLIHSLSPSTAVAYLLIADIYGLGKLKIAAIDLIVKNYAVIRKKDDWKHLLKSQRVELLNELFEAIDKKIDKKSALRW